MNTSNFFYCFNVSFGCCEFRLLLYTAYIVVNSLRCHMTTLNFGVIIISLHFLSLRSIAGVIFDQKLSRKPHLEYVIAKCKSPMNLMKALCSYHWGASKKALLLIYKSLIRSVIDYGDVVYSSASKSMLDKLSSVQTEAL